MGGGGRGLPPERGAGIGSFFSALYSRVVPVVKSALRIGSKALKSPAAHAIKKEAKKTAMKAGLEIVGDALQGKNVVQSTKQNLKKAKNRMVKKVTKMAKNMTSSEPSVGNLKLKKWSGGPKKRGGKIAATPAALAQRTLLKKLQQHVAQQQQQQKRGGGKGRKGGGGGGKKRGQKRKAEKGGKRAAECAPAAKKRKGRRASDLFDM